MRLEHDEAMARFVAHDHGILCTAHAKRGVDAVPCVFAVDENLVGIPVDRVKPKSSPRLQRERNLGSDSRATLLVEHWDRQDWSQLWWVRVSLLWNPDPPHEQWNGLAAILENRYPQYRGRPFDRIHVMRIVQVTGWAAR